MPPHIRPPLAASRLNGRTQDPRGWCLQSCPQNRLSGWYFSLAVSKTRANSRHQNTVLRTFH